MNNTQNNLYLLTECSGISDGNNCKTLGSEGISLSAFKRMEVFTINYDEGVKTGKTYTLKSYFNVNNQAQKRNFISVTVKGDMVGSRIQSVDTYIDGQYHNLLNSNNSSNKVLPNVLGHFSYTDIDGSKYTIYATAQHDKATAQGIDSIYLTVDKDSPVLAAENDPNVLSLMTYNIQAFPNYIGLGLDLNKLNIRMDYLSTKAMIDNYDVISFQEAWDRDSRKEIKANLAKYYPYSLDPVPVNDHNVALYSGLLVLSKYPITASKFIDYLDYQNLTDADMLSNKGALYFQINKNGRRYNFITTHTQAENDAKALGARQEEFGLIRDYLINDPKLNISKNEPLILMGDLNTDYYTSSQYDYMKNILNLDDNWLNNTLYQNPKYSYDSDLSLMMPKGTNEHGMYDYIVPINGYTLPQKVDYQITPLRAVNYEPMYNKSYNMQLYSFGDVEISDHFMVQGKFYFPNN